MIENNNFLYQPSVGVLFLPKFWSENLDVRPSIFSNNDQLSRGSTSRQYPQIFLNPFLCLHAPAFPQTTALSLKNIRTPSTSVFLQPRLWGNIFWVCVLPELEPELRTQVQVVYFRSDFRKHSRNLGKWDREWKKGNGGWITKQVSPWADSLISLGFLENHLKQ